MPLLIILLAWRLVIESFVDIFGVSSLCMQIIRKCKSIGLSRKAQRACESVILARVIQLFTLHHHSNDRFVLFDLWSIYPCTQEHANVWPVTYSKGFLFQSLELGVGWHEGIICFWYYNCYFPILTSAWDKIIAVNHLAHSPDDASKKHQQQLLWHWR